MTSKELVGPLPTVTFYGGPRIRFGEGVRWAERARVRPRVAYAPPKNTLDLRHVLCTDHHVACDCREAEHQENLQELRYEIEYLKAAIRRHVTGHLVEPEEARREVFDHWEYGRAVFRYEPALPCQCTGCEIARDASVYPA